MAMALLPPSSHVSRLIDAGRILRDYKRNEHAGFGLMIDEYGIEFCQFATDVLHWSETHPGAAFLAMVEDWSHDRVVQELDTILRQKCT